MSYDGLFTHSIVNELKDHLVGGRVNKIHQPYPDELLIRIRANRKNYNLLLSAHPQYARVQLTNLKFENPQQAPQFCMVARKYIETSTLVDIQQVENDRIIEFTFTGRDELGDEQHYYLIAEIMGRHSNILLVNKEEGKLYEAIRHVPASQNSYRTLLPGANYKAAPKQDSVNPFAFTGSLNIEGENSKAQIQSIQKQFQGFGRDSAKELLYLIEADKEQESELIFQNFIQKYRDHAIQPSLTEEGNRASFTAFPYSTIKGEITVFPTLAQLLDEYYENKAERDRVHQQSNDLSQLLNNELKKNINKLKKLEREYKETERGTDYRIKGEVLTAYMHTVNHGMEEITLENFYENNDQILIELDPRKTPAENAQWYFNRYQKMKNRKRHLTREIPMTKQEIDYLESLLAQLEIASSGDIEDIREELREQGYLKKQRKNKSKKRDVSKPEKYYSTDGDLILVGKNNKQNDELTMKTANKTDWWLHTKDIPGSHVVIRNDKPTKQTIEEAAILAAYNSKYRMSSSVPVDYTQIKHVRKPNGAKPGYVIYENQNTVFVTPDKNLVRQLTDKPNIQ